MLPKKYRLPLDPTQPPRLAGKTIHHSLFTLVYSSNQVHHLRLAVVISKKISPKAVVRNHLKRQIHHALKEVFNLTTPIDLLLIPKPASTTTPYSTLKKELSILLKQLSVQ